MGRDNNPCGATLQPRSRERGAVKDRERIERTGPEHGEFWPPSLNSITVTLPGGLLDVSAGAVVLPDMAEFRIVDSRTR
ncbi:hypothetical protein KGO5_03324 [Sinorhizobium sp. KGO-5]|nr:hypothetical protein KGO5_03324 [Sinorhizobium sp. KGO-5]